MKVNTPLQDSESYQLIMLHIYVSRMFVFVSIYDMQVGNSCTAINLTSQIPYYIGSEIVSQVLSLPKLIPRAVKLVCNVKDRQL